MQIRILVFGLGFLGHLIEAGRILGTLCEYEYWRSECLTSAYNDYAAPALLGTLYNRYPSSGTCLNSNGVQRGVVSKNISRLMPHLPSSYLTAEMWVEFDEKNGNGGSLLSFCNTMSSPTQCNLEVILKGSLYNTTKEFFVRMTYNIGGLGATSISFPSVTITPSSKSPDLIRHVVVGVQYNTTQLGGSQLFQTTITYTLDGDVQTKQSNTKISDDGPWDPTTWNRASQMTVLGDVAGTVSNYGKVYLVALYPKKLSNAEILQNYKAGLPNSVPVPLSSTISIQENGEVGDHSLDPSYYNTEIQAASLPLIYFKVFDLDSTTASPNYNITNHGYGVAIIPPDISKCTLYHLDGSPFVGTVWTLQNMSSLVSARIRPAKNLYSSSAQSVFCTISFHAVDTMTSLYSVELGTISVIVTHVDIPPVATPLSLGVYADKLTTIVLSGTDVDSAVASTFIVSLPQLGQLFQIFDNGTTSSAPISLTGSASIRISNSQRKVLYRYSSRAATTLGFQDKFYFAVADVEGRRSVPASVNISILPSLLGFRGGPSGAISSTVSFPFSPAIAIENTLSSISVFAQDMSDNHRNISAMIMSLPLRGVLFKDSKGLFPAIIGDSFLLHKISAVGLSVAVLYYRGRTSYFSYPSITWNGTVLPANTVALDSFSFKIFSTTINSTDSPMINQPISVQNVNQPTILQYPPPAAPIKIEAFSDGVTDSGSSLLDVASLSGFELLDPDLDTGLVVVHISTIKGGVVTLNQNHIGFVDFNSFAYCNRIDRWQCVGSGYFATRLVFVTAASKLIPVLNGMTYQSTIAHIDDTINITVYDGEGGDCLDNIQQTSAVIRSGCFSSSVAVQVSVGGYHTVTTTTSTTTYKKFTTIDYRLKIVAIGIVIIILIFMCRCCCRGCKSCRWNSRKKDPQWSQYSRDFGYDGKRGYSSDIDVERGDVSRQSRDWLPFRSRTSTPLKKPQSPRQNPRSEYSSIFGQSSSRRSMKETQSSRNEFSTWQRLFSHWRPSPLDDLDSLDKQRKRRLNRSAIDEESRIEMDPSNETRKLKKFRLWKSTSSRSQKRPNSAVSRPLDDAYASEQESELRGDENWVAREDMYLSPRKPSSKRMQSRRSKEFMSAKSARPSQRLRQVDDFVPSSAVHQTQRNFKTSRKKSNPDVVMTSRRAGLKLGKKYYRQEALA